MKQRKRYSSHHVGRLREAVAEILNRSFPDMDVLPSEVYPATGYWRTSPYADVYRWEATGVRKEPKTKSRAERVPVPFGCWSTMTEFVRECGRAGGVCHAVDGTVYPGPDPDSKPERR